MQAEIEKAVQEVAGDICSTLALTGNQRVYVRQHLASLAAKVEKLTREDVSRAKESL